METKVRIRPKYRTKKEFLRKKKKKEKKEGENEELDPAREVATTNKQIMKR